MASCKYNPGINNVNPYAVLNVTQQSQNVAANTSVVRWELLLYRPSNITSSASKSFSIIINGSTVKNGTTTIGGSGTKSIASGTTTINHNADGTKSISFSFSLQFDITWSGKKIGTGSASGNMALSTIPRATMPTLSPSTVTMGNNITINLPRASTAFTHTLQHDFYAGAWTTFATGATISAALTTPIDWANAIPNATSGGGRIRCLTYNGGTLIGEKIVNFTATIPASVVPSISNITAVEAVSGIAQKFRSFVKSKTKLSVSVSAAGAYKSTIKSYSTKIDGSTYTGSSFESGLINSSGTVSIVTTVTDSRGRTATKEVKISVLDYSPPIVTTFSAIRGNSAEQADDEGTFALIRLNFSISPVNNLNDKSYKVEYKEQNASTWKTLGTWSAYSYNGTWNAGNILNADHSYMMRLTITDYFTEITVETDDISSAFTLIDFNASGYSIAFGGVSERSANEKAVDFKMEIYDMHGTRINNGMSRYTGSGSNGIDPNTTKDELILTDVNTPNGKFMYIKTVFYVDKSASSNRAQTAIPYNTNGSTYHRYYSDGVWSSWRRHANADEISQLTQYVNDLAAFSSKSVSARMINAVSNKFVLNKSKGEENMQKVEKETLARTVVLIVALLNNILTMAGYNPLPFSDDEVYMGVTAVFTVAASLWAWWKNNSFTQKAIEADKILHQK